MYRLLFYLLSGCLLLLFVAGESSLEEQSSEEIVMDTTAIYLEDFPAVSAELMELGEPSVDEQNVMTAQKINWMPVWQEQDQDNPRVARQVMEESSTERQVLPTSSTEKASYTAKNEVSSTEAISTVMETTTKNSLEELLSTRDNKECPSTAQRGLTNLIRVARPMLPAAELRNIFANAVEDPQVRDLLTLLKSNPFKEQVALLRSTKQHQMLQDYICRRLKLDPAYYFDYVRIFLNIHTTEAPTSPLPNRRKGIRGLLQDVRDVLPRTALRDLYLRMYASDAELSNAVRLVRSLEFRRLLQDVRSLKEYRGLTGDLEKAGVPLRQIQQLVASALGWATLDATLGAETVIFAD
ncbi:GL19108 [Drosophila persimilis]|uniref:GL19108 n=1 Tax=Drosophila persimilis TaxID=7234 RepID=B4G6U1_DROPE|nr:GL19108 [Drosophila persimilis]